MFEKNVGEYLSIDETSLSNGELYTILSNKSGKGNQGTLVAMVAVTESSKVIGILKKISKSKRDTVKEITLDMAGSMNKIAESCFPKANIVTDRFHVQKLAFDAVQEIRIAHRWQAIEKENKAIKAARKAGKTYQANEYQNGDTLKQLLARSRYLLFKSRNNWTTKQNARAKILFEVYSDLGKAYNLSDKLRKIYSHSKSKGIAFTKLAQWYNEVEKTDFKSFGTIVQTMKLHYSRILNCFDNKSTNASAESFNAKIKAFRRTQRGVNDISFFLYRVAKIFA